jgi:hypothetical protein
MSRLVKMVTFLGLFAQIDFLQWLTSVWSTITDLWSKNPQAIIAIIALGVSLSAVYFQRRTVNTQENNSKHQRLIEVYNLNNDVENREARKNIYKAYKIYKSRYYKDGEKIGGKTYTAKYQKELIDKKYDNIFSDPKVLAELGEAKTKTIQQDVERVRATLDHIGALFNNKLIPKEALMKAMWGVVIYCWDALEHQIYIERDVRRTKDYMTNFQDFYTEIENYVKRKKMDRVRLEDTDLDEVWRNP